MANSAWSNIQCVLQGVKMVKGDQAHVCSKQSQKCHFSAELLETTIAVVVSCVVCSQCTMSSTDLSVVFLLFSLTVMSSCSQEAREDSPGTRFKGFFAFLHMCSVLQWGQQKKNRKLTWLYMFRLKQTARCKSQLSHTDLTWIQLLSKELERLTQRQEVKYTTFYLIFLPDWINF